MNIRKEIFLGVRRQGFYKFKKPRSEQEINSLLDELNAYTNSIKYVYDKEINFIVLRDCRTNKNHFLSDNKLVIDAFNNYYGIKELKSNVRPFTIKRMFTRDIHPLWSAIPMGMKRRRK